MATAASAAGSTRDISCTRTSRRTALATRARNSWPRPSNTDTVSPTPSRSTRVRCSASSRGRATVSSPGSNVGAKNLCTWGLYGRSFVRVLGAWCWVLGAGAGCLGAGCLSAGCRVPGASSLPASGTLCPLVTLTDPLSPGHPSFPNVRGVEHRHRSRGRPTCELAAPFRATRTSDRLHPRGDSAFPSTKTSQCVCAWRTRDDGSSQSLRKDLPELRPRIP